MTSLKQTLTMLIASGIAAGCLLTGISLWTAHQNEVFVDDALDAKDIIADILPPPMYLIESRLVLSQAIEGTLPAEKALSEADRLEKEYNARVAYWSSHPTHGLRTSLDGKQHQAALRFFQAERAVLMLAVTGDRAGASKALQEADAAFKDHREGVAETVKMASAFADQSLTQLASTRRLGSWMGYGVSAVATLVLIALGIWARRSIMAATGGEPAEAAAIANAVAAGDLTVRVKVAPGDTTSVMAAMARMCDSLVELVQTVRSSSGSVAAGAGQIATGNADLSQRTEEQASNLQQTAASMEQINATVKNSAESARQAAQLADAASQVATKGGEVVGQVVLTMDDISNSSKKIGDIIGVIDGIAFQTNILALNAAVEAARAGEQGRGFAVVASEVRILAQRSAEAAKEIKVLIGASADKVESGARLVKDAGSTMSDIVVSVKRVADLIGEISAATHEQTAGIGQITTAVSEMDQVTQQNAALVEEASAAADSLQQQAQTLVQAVSVFRLAEDGTMAQEVIEKARHAAPSSKAVSRAAPKAAAHQPSTNEADWETF